jgi:dihydroxy-acid dehydratase
MRSDLMKKGAERAPHRSLCKAMGYTDEELKRPIIGVANSANEVIPGHKHLDEIASAVKMGIAMAGGTPMEFSTIGVCDGIAMGHSGMKYLLQTLLKSWRPPFPLTGWSWSAIAIRSCLEC